MSHSHISGKAIFIGTLSIAAAFVFASDKDYNELVASPKTSHRHGAVQKCSDVQQDYNSRVSVPCSP